MINFDTKQKIFSLSNSNVTYAFFVNELGQLQHLYYGKPNGDLKIKDICDFGEDWAKHYYDFGTKEEKVLESTYFNRSMFEAPTSGYDDPRVRMIDIFNKKSDFRFVRYEISKGVHLTAGLPHFRDDGKEGETLHIVLKDTNKEIYLHLYYSLLEDYPIIFKNQTLENKDESLFLNKAHTFNLDIPKAGFDLIHFPGEWNHERTICREAVNRGIKKISSNTGRSSHEENPYLFLLEKGANENEGEVYSFSLVYSGNFAFEIEADKYGSTRISGGINEEDFLFEVKKGESFVFPEAILGYSENGIGRLSRATHDLIRNNLIPNPNPELKETILLNSWEGCYMDFDTDKIVSYIHTIKKVGARLFVLDDGWFGNRDDDSTSLGDWWVNEKKIDLARVVDECHKCGMKFGLWFEPEMISPKSKLFAEHPEYAAVNLKDNPYLSRHQLPLDLCNKDVLENILDQIDRILGKYEIDYVKWDHNRTIDSAYSSALDDEHQGEFYHRNVLGFYYLLEELTKRHPHTFFHGCASGGGRFDLGSLYYSPDIWTSDNTDPIDRLFIQYSTSMLYPLTTMGAHVSDKNSASYLSKARIAMFGTYGFEFDPNKLSQNEIDELLETNKLFDKYHKEVISDGDLYRISSPYDGICFEMCSVSKDKTKALHLLVNLVDRNDINVKIPGLDKSKKYKNSYDGRVLSGDFYSQTGLDVLGGLKKRESLLIILEEK